MFVSLIMTENQTINDITLNDLDDMDPQDIAHIIFSEQPKPEKSHQMLGQSIDGSQLAFVDVFEVFVNILMEGIFIRYPNISSETLKQFDSTMITNLSPWLRSLGFDVNVHQCSVVDKNDYENFYCKIILKCDPCWAGWFEIKNIENNYHFILGGNSHFLHNIKCTQDNMFAVFIMNDIVYKISFHCI